MARLLGALALSILIILMYVESPVEGFSCTVGLGGDYPDVSSAVSNGCVNIEFVSDVSESSSVSVSSSLYVYGRGYRWIFQGNEGIRVNPSTTLYIEGVNVSRGVSTNSLLEAVGSTILLMDVVIYNDISGAWNESIYILDSNVTMYNVSIFDLGTHSRNSIFISDSDAYLDGVYIENLKPVIAGGIWFDDTASREEESYIARNIYIKSFDRGVMFWDDGNNNATLLIDNAYVEGQLRNNIVLWLISKQNPPNRTNITIVNSYLANVRDGNIWLFSWYSQRTLLNLKNLTILNATAYANIWMEVKIRSHFNISLENLTISNAGDLPYGNIFIDLWGGDAEAVIYMDSLRLTGADVYSIYIRTQHATSFNSTIRNSMLNTASPNSFTRGILIYTRWLSTGYLEMDGVRVDGASIGFLGYIAGSSRFTGRLSNVEVLNGRTGVALWTRTYAVGSLYVSNGLVNDMDVRGIWVGGWENSQIYVEVEGIYINDTGLEGIKIFHRSPTPSTYRFIDVIINNSAGIGLNMTVDGDPIDVFFNRSIIGSVWLRDSLNTFQARLYANQTMYDELGSQVDGIYFESYWILEARYISSLSGYPISGVRVSLIDGSTILSTKVTGLDGDVRYVLHYVYDESNPVVPRLYLNASVNGVTDVYHIYLDGGFRSTIPNIFVVVERELPIPAFKALGKVGGKLSTIVLYGVSGYIAVLTDLESSHGGIHPIVYRIGLKWYFINDDYAVIGVELYRDGEVYKQMLYIDRGLQTVFSPGPIRIVAWIVNP